MLEELASDVTGWGARVVEFFQLLDWTQHLEHLRLDCAGCPDLRSIERDDRIGGPWDEATRTVDVRAINEWDGWYGIRNVGFFLWRLEVDARTRTWCRAPIGGTTWRYTFSPLGNDMPLFSAGDGALTGAGRATELTVMDAIRPAAFSAALDALPAGPVGLSSAYYGEGAAARLVVWANGAAVPASDIECRTSSDWATAAQPTGTGHRRRRRARAPDPWLGQERRDAARDVVRGHARGARRRRVRPRQVACGQSPADALSSGGGAGLATAIAGRTGPEQHARDRRQPHLHPARRHHARRRRTPRRSRPTDQSRRPPAAAGGVLAIKTHRRRRVADPQRRAARGRHPRGGRPADAPDPALDAGPGTVGRAGGGGAAHRPEPRRRRLEGRATGSTRGSRCRSRSPSRARCGSRRT